MRIPLSAGDVLNEEYLIPLSMSRRELAERTGLDIETINRLISGKIPLTPRMASAFSGCFNTSSGFWLNIQKKSDAYHGRFVPKDSPDSSCVSRG